MLHILWMILKFILILLGILLGILVTLLLLILFCPICYQAEAKKTAEMQLSHTRIKAKIGWLFYAISVKISFIDGDLQKEICLFGIPVSKFLRFGKRNKKKEKRASGDVREIFEEEDAEEAVEEWIPPIVSDQVKPIEKELKVIEAKSNDQTIEETAKDVEEEKAEPDSDSDIDTAAPKKSIFKIIAELWKKMIGMIKKILHIPSLILEKFRKISLTFQNFCGRINKWKRIWEDERTQNAIALVWRDFKKLIIHILPTKIKGNVTFDSEDPAITGMALALLGASVPFHKNQVRVTPLFQNENYLEGNICAKGRIFLCVVIKIAIEVYIDKNVKFVIKRWKRRA